MNIRNNFSVDDIHAIREEQTKKFKSMTNEELKKYFEMEEQKFYNRTAVNKN
ncbi:MAG: hypothetical protein Q4F88_04210 [Eubacteriales bacterium]|nr:hypothetical protein [Eubacteriales bacterium]